MDSDSLIGGQILEIHVSFPILFELWFDTLLSLFSGTPEPSEVKMHRRSVVYFGRESLGALRTDADWARRVPGVCVCVCACGAPVPWLDSGSGFQEHEK